MIYLAYKELGWSEETFWNSTPDKLQAMFDCVTRYKELSSGSGDKKNTTTPTKNPGGIVSLDDIPGW